MFSIIRQDFHLFFEKQSFQSCLKDSQLLYCVETVYLSTRNESPHSYSLLFNWGKTVGTSSPPVLSFLLMHSGLTGWYLRPLQRSPGDDPAKQTSLLENLSYGHPQQIKPFGAFSS